MDWEIKTETERNLISQIAKRGVELYSQNSIEADEIDVMMDLTACHLNGCPLDLEKLSQADDFNLIHDLIGINQNISHKTGKLKNCFLPRSAAKSNS